MGLSESFDCGEVVDLPHLSIAPWTFYRVDIREEPPELIRVYRYWPDDQALNHAELVLTCRDGDIEVDVETDEGSLSASPINPEGLQTFFI